jgi:hypothetical protein
MTRTLTLQPGVEVWSCTQCSRRLLFRWRPAFAKVVLESGEERATHVGGSGVPHDSALDVESPGPVDLPAADRSWLAVHGIDWEAGDTST